MLSIPSKPEETLITENRLISIYIFILKYLKGDMEDQAQ